GLGAGELEFGLCDELELELPAGAPVLKSTCMVGVVRARERGADFHHRAVLGTPAILHFLFDLTDVQWLDVSELSAEVRAQVRVAGEVLEVSAGTIQLGYIARSLPPRPVERASEPVHRLSREHPVRAQFQPRVRRHHAIRARAEIPAGGENAEAGLIAELSPQADDPVDRAVAAQRIGRRHRPAGSAI